MFTAHSQKKQEAERGGNYCASPSSKKLLFHLGKRFFDVIGAFFGGLLFLPLMLVLMLLIRIESEGPAIFRQWRVGKNGKQFYIYKLRSMYMDAEAQGPQLAKENDSRCTRIGAFMRKHHLDELPQFWNVLKGDMSFVGPRPERAYFYEEISKSFPAFSVRLTIKPGLTGWAQVQGDYHTPPQEKLKFDLHYMKHMSWRMDLYCLWLTVKKILGWRVQR